jgi:hypothetical protein
MKKKTWNINLYLLNFALLFSHEIDSAFWREWELFGIPGGIQGFLVVNFLLLLVALFGFKQLLQGARNGYMFSLLLAVSGVFAFSIHSYFILTGHPEFTLPVSLAVLVLTLIVSLAQGFLALKELLARPTEKMMRLISLLS